MFLKIIQIRRVGPLDRVTDIRGRPDGLLNDRALFPFLCRSHAGRKAPCTGDDGKKYYDLYDVSSNHVLSLLLSGCFPAGNQGNADQSVSLAKIAGTKCLTTAIFCDPAGGF